jgi:CRP-like cAMP-binding protein
MTPSNNRNRILRLLSTDEADRITPHLEFVKLSFKEPIYEEGKAVDYLYFVLSGIVSLVQDVEESPIETGTVGCEGLVGLPAFLGNSLAPGRAFCQVPGDSLRVRPDIVRAEFSLGGNFANVLLRYTNALIGMVSQSVACLAAHPIEARMSRWLLMTRDRMESNDFPLTQEFLGQMLGVRRASVSLAGSSLQRAGLIKYSRGRITILDRPGLEAASCECYSFIRKQFDRALGSG